MNKTNTLTETINNNAGELETMRVLQLILARTIDESNSGRDIAALSKQLREVTQKIAQLEIEAEKADTEFEQIVAKYKDRQVRNETRQVMYTEES